MTQNKEYYLQITAGQGPDECCRAVYLFYKHLIKKAQKHQKMIKITEKISSKTQKKCYKSVLLTINDKEFFQQYVGTILWICQSPFRKNHKRKNWFIGVEFIDFEKDMSFNINDIIVEKTRSGGPGGQHVNKTESAIKIRHLPTKLTATASEQRCQHANKKIALWRLKLLIDNFNDLKRGRICQNTWNKHYELKRGNPVKTYLGINFQKK